MIAQLPQVRSAVADLPDPSVKMRIDAEPARNANDDAGQITTPDQFGAFATVARRRMRGKDGDRRPDLTSRMAEGVGFEPTVRVSAQRFSRPPRSTTPAPLRVGISNA